MTAMFRKKHVLFHTDASIDQAQRLLAEKTAAGSPNANDFVGMMKDTLGKHETPFRGVVEGSSFRVTRRVRGRRVRIACKGTLAPKPGGGTEIRATMEPPTVLLVSLIGGLLALLGVGGVALSQGSWAPLLALLASVVPVLWLSSTLYERETSKTFSALRDAVPAHVPQPIAPITAAQEDAAPTAVAEKTGG